MPTAFHLYEPQYHLKHKPLFRALFPVVTSIVLTEGQGPPAPGPGGLSPIFVVQIWISWIWVAFSSCLLHQQSQWLRKHSFKAWVHHPLSSLSLPRDSSQNFPLLLCPSSVLATSYPQKRPLGEPGRLHGSVKCLLCKQEGLSLIPSTQVQARHGCNSSAGRVRVGVEARDPCSSLASQASRINNHQVQWPCLHK